MKFQLLNPKSNPNRQVSLIWVNKSGACSQTSCSVLASKSASLPGSVVFSKGYGYTATQYSFTVNNIDHHRYSPGQWQAIPVCHPEASIASAGGIIGGHHEQSSVLCEPWSVNRLGRPAWLLFAIPIIVALMTVYLSIRSTHSPIASVFKKVIYWGECRRVFTSCCGARDFSRTTVRMGPDSQAPSNV